MAKKEKRKKELCSECHDKGFVEYERGIFLGFCPAQCAKSVELRAKMLAEQEPLRRVERVEPEKLPAESEHVPTYPGDRGTAGSPGVEGTGDSKPAVEGAADAVQPGAESLLQEAGPEHPV